GGRGPRGVPPLPPLWGGPPPPLRFATQGRIVGARRGRFFVLNYRLRFVISTTPLSASTLTQSPVSITCNGSCSSSVIAGACVTTAPSAILVVILLKIIARGAAPLSRAIWK